MDEASGESYSVNDADRSYVMKIMRMNRKVNRAEFRVAASDAKNATTMAEQ